MTTEVYYGNVSDTFREWCVKNYGQTEEPDPEESDTTFGHLVAALENCQPSDFNMTTLAYTGSVAVLTAFGVGQKMTVSNGYGANTQWINLGFNGSIPEYVKYRRAVGSGYKHIWLKSTGSDGLLRAIAVGDTAFVRAYDSTAKGFIYTASEDDGTVTAIDGTFTYGNNDTWAVPLQVTTSKGTYDFCGYNMTLNSEGLLQIIQFDPDASCFLAGTKITMADGTTKNVEDLTYDDVLMVWNFDEGKFDTAKPAWIMKECVNDYYFKNKYASGKELLITGKSKTGWGHRHFDIDRNEFKYIPSSIGDRTFDAEGNEDELLSSVKVQGEAVHYNIITEKHFNLFANGILTSCSLNNLYKIKDMKFVKENHEIRYEDFLKEMISLGIEDEVKTKYYFDALRIGEMNPSKTKELSEYIAKLIRLEVAR